jgi:hypothetical protein
MAVVTPTLLNDLLTLQVQRDGYASQLIRLRQMLGITDRTVYTEAGLKQLLDAYSALQGRLPTTPPPSSVPGTVPGAGGTVVTASGFTGRNEQIDPFWKKSFEDDFPIACDLGQFLTTYGRWDAYPENYFTTNANPANGGDGAHYSTKNLGVMDFQGIRALVCRMIPKSITPDHKNWGAAPAPRFDVGYGAARSPSMKGEMRVRTPDPDPDWHDANLIWFDNEGWPAGGEDDIWEQDGTGNIGCFFHNAGANAGNDQRHFSTNLSARDWHVIGWEHIAGQSFKWFVDGVQIKPDDGGDDASGTILKRVPKGIGRLVLQNEPKANANPARGMDVLYDWVTVWTPS